MAPAPDSALRGKFIVIEGVDGIGKSTQVALVARALGDLGVTVVATREPGGSELGEKVRDLLSNETGISPIAECLLMSSARAQHCADLITPSLARGDWVISDRFTGSFYAYQGYGRGVDLQVLRTLSELATGALEPDLVVLLSAGSTESYRDLDLSDRFEGLGSSFYQRVREGFMELAREPGWVSVDSYGHVDEITQRIVSVIVDYFAIPVPK